MMRNKLFRMTLLMAFSMWLIPAGLLASANPTSGQGGADDKKYAGTWVGTYTTAGGVSNALSYTLRKNDKGEWGGTLKFTNQDGEQTTEFKSLQINDGKLRAKIDVPGEVEVTIEGQFQGDRLEGTYSIAPAGTTNIVDQGTWKLTRSAAAKSEQ